MIRSTVLSFFCLLLVASCGEEQGGVGDPCSNDYDQSVLFANLADNLILPAYRAFEMDMDALASAINAFDQSPSVAGLEDARTSFREAYQQWQRIAPFDFGPAEMVFLANSLNNFPLNVEALEANVTSGNYSLDNPDAFDKGFPALDYLLFGLGASSEEIVEAYTTGDRAAEYRSYLTQVTQDMQGRFQQVLSEWENGYRSSFVMNTGTAAGTSLSLIVNSLNEHYENLRRDKLGIPAGVLTLGFTNPEKVEAPYSGLSLNLLKTSLQTSRDYFSGTTGEGIDDLLEYVDAEKNNESLANQIRDQYQLALEKLEAIEGTLQQAVEDDANDVQDAYTELQRQVVLLKTDLPAALCIAITYVDNPSDSD
jgi:predicted lipoprotein